MYSLELILPRILGAGVGDPTVLVPFLQRRFYGRAISHSPEVMLLQVLRNMITDRTPLAVVCSVFTLVNTVYQAWLRESHIAQESGAPRGSLPRSSPKTGRKLSPFAALRRPKDVPPSNGFGTDAIVGIGPGGSDGTSAWRALEASWRGRRASVTIRRTSPALLSQGNMMKTQFESGAASSSSAGAVHEITKTGNISRSRRTETGRLVLAMHDVLNLVFLPVLEQNKVASAAADDAEVNALSITQVRDLGDSEVRNAWEKAANCREVSLSADRFVTAVMLEYVRNLQFHSVAPTASLYEVIAELLVRRGQDAAAACERRRFGMPVSLRLASQQKDDLAREAVICYQQLYQLLQYHIVVDSSRLADILVVASRYTLFRPRHFVEKNRILFCYIFTHNLPHSLFSISGNTILFVRLLWICCIVCRTTIDSLPYFLKVRQSSWRFQLRKLTESMWVPAKRESDVLQ